MFLILARIEFDSFINVVLVHIPKEDQQLKQALLSLYNHEKNLTRFMNSPSCKLIKTDNSFPSGLE